MSDFAVPDEAVLMGEKHLRVVPIGVGTKHPPFEKWQLRATSDAATHSTWWSEHPDWGLGWKMGLQDDGRFLIALDVDVKRGGIERLKTLWLQYDLEDEFRNTVRARTGGDGAHFVFELAPGAYHPDNRASKDGIDVRAENGQIVVQPSIHPETGKMYRWAPEHEPWNLAPRLASSRLVDMLIDLFQTAPPPLRVVSDDALWRPGQGEGETPADWVRRTQDFSTYLIKYGWTPMRGESWCRPGKDPRFGSSAELKDDGAGPLNIFTTDVPPEVEALGVPDPTGQCISISLFDFITAYEFGGDRSACASYFRKRMNELVTRAVDVRAVPAAAPAVDTVPPPPISPEMLPPEEFWTASPIYEAIRQDAWAALMPPTLALGAVIARYAATIPCCYRIPAMVGRVGSLNLAACIVSSSGGGKTSMMDAAVYLVPSNLDQPSSDGRPGKTMFNQGMGSGEGMLDAYYEEFATETAKGKPTVERTRWYDAVNYMIDEGGAILAQLERSGTTEIDYFNSLWAGATVSTRTASKDRRRHLNAHSYRFSVALNIQTARGHRFLDRKLIETGFPQRLLFVWGDDPNLPDEDLPRPDPLDLPMWPICPETHLEYDPQIRDQVRSYRRQRARGQIVEDPLDRHYWLTREKTAAVLALMHGSQRVTGEYWDHALAIHAASDVVRKHLIHIDVVRSGDERHMAAEINGALDAVRLEASKRKQVATYAARLLRHLTAAGRDGMALADLRKKLTRDERWAWDPCIERLVGDGQVVISGQRAIAT